MSTKVRPLSNQVKWALEDVYQALLDADRHMASLINNDQPLTRTLIISKAALATSAIRSAREHITRVHPTARDIAVRRGGRASSDD